MREDTRVCKTCGEERPIERFTLSGVNRYGKQYKRWKCLGCIAKYQQKYRDKRNRRAYTAKEYKVLYDPEEVYSVCAKFSKGTVLDTLEDGYWPPGMWFQDTETGGVYEVQGNEDWHKVAQYVDEPAIKSEAQRLVRRRGDRQPPRSG